MGLLRDGLGESTCTADDSLLIPSSASTKFDCDCSLETSLETYLSIVFSNMRCITVFLNPIHVKSTPDNVMVNIYLLFVRTTL